MMPIIDPLSIFFIAVTLIMTFILPIVAVVIFGVKVKGSLPVIMLGALGFYVSQNVVRITLLSLLGQLEAVQSFANTNTEVYYFLLALSAGLFETAARVIVLMMCKKSKSYKLGLATGLGHGAIESITLVGLTYINNLVYAVLINLGVFTEESVVSVLASLEPSIFLAAGFERVFVIFVQIALMLLVCYGMYKGQTVLYAGICIALHTIFDYAIIMINHITQNIWLTEAVIALFAAGAVAFIVIIKKRFENPEVSQYQ